MQNHFLVNFLMNIQVRKSSSADSSHVKLKICKVTLFHTFFPITTRHHHRYTFTKCYDNSKDNADAIKITPPHTQVTYSRHSVASFFSAPYIQQSSSLKTLNVYGGHSFGSNLRDGWGVFSLFFGSKLQITFARNSNLDSHTNYSVSSTIGGGSLFILSNCRQTAHVSHGMSHSEFQEEKIYSGEEYLL